MQEELLRNSSGDAVYIDPGEAAVITATLTDATGANLDTASILSLTLTLYNKSTSAIINSRNATNILNTGIGTLADNGDGDALMTIYLTGADNPNVGTAVGSLEEHIALVTWTWSDAQATTQTGKQRWRIYVKPIESFA